ncbi:MAG: hypothetical protein OEL83_13585 [Desulforhopalus sp.]|nr:hypothetical protein [Desulforhopalus sp.]
MKYGIITAIALALTMIISGTFCAQTISAAAEPTGAAPKINIETSLTDNLLAYKGKMVTVTLSSGQTISGVVANVKNGLLHLEKLSQKEFFDAIVVIDRINAIEVRVKVQ